jgi:hypothetical protein
VLLCIHVYGDAPAVCEKAVLFGRPVFELLWINLVAAVHISATRWTPLPQEVSIAPSVSESTAAPIVHDRSKKRRRRSACPESEFHEFTGPGARHPAGIRRALTVSQASDATRIPRAASRRCLYTLARLGFVSEDHGRYSLRPKVLTLGLAYMSSLPP